MSYSKATVNREKLIKELSEAVITPDQQAIIQASQRAEDRHVIASQKYEDLCEIMADDDFDQLPSYYRGN